MLQHRHDAQQKRENTRPTARLRRARELRAVVGERFGQRRLGELGFGLFEFFFLVLFLLRVVVELLGVAHLAAGEQTAARRLLLDDRVLALGERLLHGLGQDVLQAHGLGLVVLRGLFFGSFFRLGFHRLFGLFRAGEGDDGDAGGLIRRFIHRFFRRLRLFRQGDDLRRLLFLRGRLACFFFRFGRGGRAAAVLGQNALEREFRVLVHAAGRVFQQQLGVGERFFKFKVFGVHIVPSLPSLPQALAHRLVEEDGRRRGGVERRNFTLHRDADEEVALFAHQSRHAVALAADDDGRGALEVRGV